VAELLGIDFVDLSPELLRQFIVAHEMGHASDYVKNYENNPDLSGPAVAEEWNLHYEANLLAMPVPGMDPVDLRQTAAEYADLQSFLNDYPEAVASVKQEKITCLDDLIRAQEAAYRASPYEKYADDFATEFLKNNADELGFEAFAEKVA
jgi:hypothetical protein